MSDVWENMTDHQSQSALHQRPYGNITSLLAKRREWGTLTHRSASRFRGAGVTPTTLSSSVAWNASRMQNMILAVGPGTPASVVMMPDSDSSSSSSSSPSSASSSSHHEDEEDEKEEEHEAAQEQAMQDASAQDSDAEEAKEDEEEELFLTGRARWVLRTHARQQEEQAQRRRNRERSSSSEAEDDIPYQLAQRAILNWIHADDDDDDDGEEQEEERRRVIQATQQHQKNVVAAPSIRHGGCINAAAWLTCPWRLSLANHDSDFGVLSSSQSSNNEALATSVPADDCPTQLITSGDDRLVKFWDVRYAMGTSNPLPGGMNTICPFSAPTVASPQAASNNWKEYQKHSDCPISGMVIPLAALPTGHRGNVFHATPLPFYPGRVATCGADGYVRMVDVETASASTIVVSPEFDSDDVDGVLPAGLLSLRAGMCFSHHFLNANTGLLCSERGLRRFDLRLNPREQRSRSILGGPYRTCKSCAIWSASSTSSDDVDSAYVFAGGSSGDVALYDLRMADGSATKVVQHYRPRDLSHDASVSVSGLDISRDKRELLVSYENDQIYTFPIFPEAKSAAGPTVDELTACCQAIDSDEGKTSVLRELASYGGHLNRYTFLKQAKYAGPEDEYICTGSDSGNAWIYERATGAVVSLLNADNSTCNGVVPHPTLPLFITYGIDSTAKLWRATTPVDHEVDDSPLGRSRCHNKRDYEKSPVIQNWKNVQTMLLSINDSEDSFSVLPDQVPSKEEEMERTIYESLGSLFFRRRRAGPRGPGGPYIGNNLFNLPELLRQNMYACVRAQESGDDEPVKSGLGEFKGRISTIRLRHQADQNGLVWDSSLPWIMRPRDYYVGKDAARSDSSEESGTALKPEVRDALKYGHPSDLVPDGPSDWIPYDPEMTSTPRPCATNFNTEDYGDFYRERYGSVRDIENSVCGDSDRHGPWMRDNEKSGRASEDEQEPESITMKVNGVHDENSETRRRANQLSSDVISSSEDDAENRSNSKHGWKLLFDTAILLKESGNHAMQAGAISVAACRYDKAIQYCAVAFMRYPCGNVEFVEPQQASLRSNGGHEVRWSPLFKVLINTRLNLAMAMLKPQLADHAGAAEQARQALQELKPFTAEKGKVMMGPKLEQVRPGDEPLETFKEAKELQAKAYFRLGTAQYTNKDFAGAVRSFEHSIKSTKEASEDSKPDSVVLRRLAEAKRANAKKKKRHRKKFKAMLAMEEQEQEEKCGVDGKSQEDQMET